MKTIASLFLFFTFLSLHTFALDHRQQASLYEHMVEVNKQWKKLDAKDFTQIVSFESDVERIEMHLLLVEKNLRSIRGGQLSLDQRTNRFKMLDVLHAYALRKKFPVNAYHSVRQPYFIDQFETHCAVGFLVKESGFGWISKAISEEQNYSYVREIESPELVK